MIELIIFHKNSCYHSGSITVSCESVSNMVFE